MNNLSMKGAASGTDHLGTASSLHALADLYLKQGKYAEAEPLYQQALSICEQQVGANHPLAANSFNSLAFLYQKQRKYAEAERLNQQALSIREQQVGADHPDTATSLNNFGSCYLEQGKYLKAEPLLRRALAIRQQQLGTDHPVTATTLSNLAFFYQGQGEYAEADRLYRQALSIREQRLGADHPDTATILSNLAFFYRKQGKDEEAERLYWRALVIREQRLGMDHPDTAFVLNHLAGLYREQGKDEEAESLYRRALSTHEQQVGADHPNMAASLTNLALFYSSQGKYAQAESLLLRALAIGEQQERKEQTPARSAHDTDEAPFLAHVITCARKGARNLLRPFSRQSLLASPPQNRHSVPTVTNIPTPLVVRKPAIITYHGWLAPHASSITMHWGYNNWKGISYSSRDQEFVESLYVDLQSKGVRCWYAPEDMKIGEKIRQRIDESIRLYDKLLLVLSQQSVASVWVEYEVEAALAKERRESRVVLFPIRVDNAVMESPSAWAAHIKDTRNIGNFTRWKEHDAYQQGLKRLLRDLQPDKPPPMEFYE